MNEPQGAYECHCGTVRQAEGVARGTASGSDERQQDDTSAPVGNEHGTRPGGFLLRRGGARGGVEVPAP